MNPMNGLLVLFGASTEASYHDNNRSTNGVTSSHSHNGRYACGDGLKLFE